MFSFIRLMLPIRHFFVKISPHALMDIDNNQHSYCVSYGQGVVQGVLHIAPTINPIKELEELSISACLIAPGRGSKGRNV